jgi:integrase/recombinase XerC
MPRLAAPTSTSTPSSAVNAVSLVAALDQWYVYLRGSDRIGSPRTITAYQYGTGKLVSGLSPDITLSDIQPAAIERMLSDLKTGGMSPAGRMAVYRPLATFFRWCVKRGYLSESPMGGIEPPKVKAPDVEYVDDSEWAAILATCVSASRHDFRAVRDRAILLILGTTGARVSEVANLKVGDIDLHDDTMLVHGKGGKDRLLPLLPDAKAALLVYLNRGRGRSSFAVLPDLWLGPKGAVTASGIAQMCAERGKAAGVARRVHPHELRHRFIATAMRKGMPSPLVMALSGHSTPAMLNRYGSFNRQQDAMAMLREMAGRAS